MHENAIKYNKPHGQVKVVLDADHQAFTLDISDTGIGIPPESVDHIFERFYRVDKSHSREIGGTGLGLAIARSAILMHRGTIKTTSEKVWALHLLLEFHLVISRDKGGAI